MSNHHSINQVPQSAPLCGGQPDQTQSGTFNRTERSNMISAGLFPKKRKRPGGNVDNVPDAYLNSSVAILDYTKAHGAETVLVCAEYAKHFKQAPQDGRTYIVEDPRRPHVLHCTYPDGSYMRFDTKSPPTVGGMPIIITPQKVFHRDRKNGNQSRLAHKVCAKATIVRQDDALPAICLIDIHQVMRITGFKKSFIYERADFPTAVRLGSSRRSSVRWVAEEVRLWVLDLMSKRSSNKIST